MPGKKILYWKCSWVSVASKISHDCSFNGSFTSLSLTVVWLWCWSEADTRSSGWEDCGAVTAGGHGGGGTCQPQAATTGIRGTPQRRASRTTEIGGTREETSRGKGQFIHDNILRILCGNLVLLYPPLMLNIIAIYIFLFVFWKHHLIYIRGDATSAYLLCFAHSMPEKKGTAATFLDCLHISLLLFLSVFYSINILSCGTLTICVRNILSNISKAI